MINFSTSGPAAASVRIDKYFYLINILIDGYMLQSVVFINNDDIRNSTTNTDEYDIEVPLIQYTDSNQDYASCKKLTIKVVGKYGSRICFHPDIQNLDEPTIYTVGTDEYGGETVTFNRNFCISVFAVDNVNEYI